jgi:preprotein translocase subunit YajC
MFISTAYAQAAAAPTDGGGMQQLMSLAPLVLIFVVFYFLLIRPQQKKMKEHKAMLEALRRGDKVVTGGGIVGTVVKVGTDDDVTVEIAEGVRVRVMRGSITSVLSKTEPVKGEDK